MLTQPFHKGKKILDILEKNHYKAYFVGGCVRDLLLDRTIGDIDIATSARPEDIQRLFPKVIPIGIEHGTVIVRFEYESFEVTTFRIDGKYSDQRHPDDVQFIDNIEYDLERRDFTMNAIAMDQHGNIIDPYGGTQDIQREQIRTVGNGYDRFMEDPLRIIRALRFVSQLGFSIEEQTCVHMMNVKDEIRHIAVERITNECEKLFAGQYVKRGVKYLIETKTYEHLPIMLKYPYIVEKLDQMIQPLHSFGEVIALFHLLERDVSIDDWAKAWKCSNRMKREAIILVHSFDYYIEHTLDEWLVYQLTPTYFSGFVRLIEIIHQHEDISTDMLQTLYEKLPIHSRQDISIRGEDIIRLFPHQKKGPWISHLLANIEKNIVLRKLSNNYDQIKEWIRCNPPDINLFKS